MTKLADPARKTAAVVPVPPSILTIASDLEALLIALAAEHRDLLLLGDAHRAAIAAADREAIDRCALLQQQTASRLTQLDGRRLSIVRSAAAALRSASPRFTGEPTVSTIAALCPEPRRSRLLEQASQLRELAQRTQQQQRTLKLAAETLLAHMQGLMAQVSRALSHAGTYTRPLAQTYTPQVVTALDMTS